jgi:hypothetical protein
MHLGLTAEERDLLMRNGFVVPARATFQNYGFAMHEIHRRQLPLYVSADAILHAVFRDHQALMERRERDMATTLADAVGKMQAALPRAKEAYPPDVARDAELYLEVTHDIQVVLPSYPGSEEPPTTEAGRIVQKAVDAHGPEPLTLFGRARVVDWSRFTPRGHYTEDHREDYFRLATWLSRLELNLVSRSTRSSAPSLDPRETPREAVLALALGDLARRAGVLDAVRETVAAWSAFAGPTEVVTLPELADLAARIGDLRDEQAAATRLRTLLGSGHLRTVNFHVMPWGTGELPVIGAFLGVGVGPESRALPVLMRSGEPMTRQVRTLDIAYVLGHDRAKDLLARHGGFDAGVENAARKAVDARTGPDLYATWLSAVRALAVPPQGAVPSFMGSAAFADARVASAIVGYGQLRHEYVLYGVDVYDSPGCEIPDAFVEPALPVYDAVLAYVDRARSSMGDEYTAELDDARRLLSALRAIVVDELAGRALSPAERSFLAMVAEYVPPGAYENNSPGKFNGWYPHLFVGRDDAFRRGSFVSDVAVSSTRGTVTYLGATQPRVGIFVVDSGGPPRVMVGPVARSFERIERLGKRLADPDVRDYVPKVAAWEASYVAHPHAIPDWSAQLEGQDVVVTSHDDLGAVTVELLDAHGDTRARAALTVLAPESARARLDVPPDQRSGARPAFRLRLADGSAWEEAGPFWDTLDRAEDPH